MPNISRKFKKKFCSEASEFKNFTLQSYVDFFTLNPTVVLRGGCLCLFLLNTKTAVNVLNFVFSFTNLSKFEPNSALLTATNDFP